MKILEQLKQGDKKAIDQLYDKVYPRINKDAESAFCEALVVLYRQLRNPDFRLPCDLEDYIYSIAVHIFRQKPCFKLDDQTIRLIEENERKRIIQKRFRQSHKLK